MDSRQFQYYDSLMYHVGLYYRQGCTFAGLYPGNCWPVEKPPETAVQHGTRRKHAPLVPDTQPKETRQQSTSRPLMAKVDLEVERAASRLFILPLDLQQFCNVAWLDKCRTVRDISAIMALSSRQVRNRKSVVFNEIMLYSV